MIQLNKQLIKPSMRMKKKTTKRRNKVKSKISLVKWFLKMENQLVTKMK
jgi:hypothetical protein